MAFAAFLHPKAVKVLEKIAISIKERITDNLKELRDRPEKVGNP